MSKIMPEYLQFVAGDAGRNYQKLVDAVTGAVIDEMRTAHEGVNADSAEGGSVKADSSNDDEPSFSYWYPDRMKRSISLRSDNRNVLAVQVNWVARSMEVSILRYMKNIIDGYLAPRVEKWYVNPDSQLVRYPVYTPFEVKYAMAELVRRSYVNFSSDCMDFYQQAVAEFVETDDLRVSKGAFYQGEPQEHEIGINRDYFIAGHTVFSGLKNANIDMLDIPWGKWELLPRFDNERFLHGLINSKWNKYNSLRDEKVWKEGVSDALDRITTNPNTTDGSKKPILNYPAKLEQDQDEKIPAELAFIKSSAKQVLDDYRTMKLKDGVKTGAEHNEFKSAMHAVRVHTFRYAEYKAQERRIGQIQDLYKKYTLSHLDKLSLSIKQGESSLNFILGQEAHVPLKTMSELRYHLEGLRENWKLFVDQEARKRLSDAYCVLTGDEEGVHKLTPDEMTESVEYIISKVGIEVQGLIDSLNDLDLGDRNDDKIRSALKGFSKSLGEELKHTIVKKEVVSYPAAPPHQDDNEQETDTSLEELPPVVKETADSDKSVEGLAKIERKAARADFDAFNVVSPEQVNELNRTRAVKRQDLKGSTAASRLVKAYDAYNRYLVRQAGRDTQQKAEKDARLCHLASLLGIESQEVPSPEGLAWRLGGHISAKQITKLCTEGLFNHNKLLRAVVRYAQPPYVINYVQSLLAQGADVDYKELPAGALTEAFAYKRTLEDGNSQEDRAAYWRVFTLLKAAEGLLVEEVVSETDWSQDLTNKICTVVDKARKTNASFFQIRDEKLVKNILKRLVMSLCTGKINREIVRSSWFFVQLKDMWHYLSLGVPTAQWSSEESCRGVGGSSSKPVLMVDRPMMNRQILGLVMAFCLGKRYQGLNLAKYMLERDDSLIGTVKDGYSESVAKQRLKESTGLHDIEVRAQEATQAAHVLKQESSRKIQEAHTRIEEADRIKAEAEREKIEAAQIKNEGELKYTEGVLKNAEGDRKIVEAERLARATAAKEAAIKAAMDRFNGPGNPAEKFVQFQADMEEINRRDFEGLAAVGVFAPGNQNNLVEGGAPAPRVAANQ